jgi:hypothetical protein
LLVDNDILPFSIIDDRGWRRGRIDGESWTQDDLLTQLGKGDALVWIRFEYSAEDGIELVRQREDRSQKVRVS